jgi:hypothetical protein
MKTEFMPRPLPEAFAETERRAKEQLAELEAEFRRRAEPILRILAELERLRPPAHIMLIPETDAERESLTRGLLG